MLLLTQPGSAELGFEMDSVAQVLHMYALSHHSSGSSVQAALESPGGLVNTKTAGPTLEW